MKSCRRKPLGMCRTVLKMADMQDCKASISAKHEERSKPDNERPVERPTICKPWCAAPYVRRIDDHAFKQLCDGCAQSFWAPYQEA